MKTKRILAIILLLSLVFSLAMPTVVFAGENDDEQQVELLEPLQKEEEPAEEEQGEDPAEEEQEEEPVEEEQEQEPAEDVQDEDPEQVEPDVDPSQDVDPVQGGQDVDPDQVNQDEDPDQVDLEVDPDQVDQNEDGQEPVEEELTGQNDELLVEEAEVLIEGAEEELPALNEGSVAPPEAVVTANSNLGPAVINGTEYELDAGYTFSIDEASIEPQLAVYGDWNCDFVVSFDKAVAAGTVGMYGQYGSYAPVSFLNPADIAAGAEIMLVREALGGDTTLNLNAGQDSNYSGTVKLGPGIHIGYYSQDTADSLDMDGTVFSQVSAYGNEGQIRNALGAFLFHGDDIEKRASVLSGGERSRLALLKILLQPANLLILDEPTNHLDISAKTMLLNALKLYTGTIIFVSHDAQFIKELADSILYLSEDEPQLFRGDYDYFEYRLSLKNSDSGNQTKTQSPEPEPAKEAKTDWAEANRRKNRLRKLERETEALLEQIGELDKRLAETDALINLPENYSDPVKINALLSEKKTLESEKAELEGKWLENTALLEESES